MEACNRERGRCGRAKVRQILGEGIRTATIGAAVGLVAGVWTTPLLRAMFLEVSVTDPMTLTSVTALLLVVAIAASLFPPLRASAVNPLGAMK